MHALLIEARMGAYDTRSKTTHRRLLRQTNTTQHNTTHTQRNATQRRRHEHTIRGTTKSHRPDSFVRSTQQQTPPNPKGGWPPSFATPNEPTDSFLYATRVSPTFAIRHLPKLVEPSTLANQKRLIVTTRQRQERRATNKQMRIRISQHGKLKDTPTTYPKRNKTHQSIHSHHITDASTSILLLVTFEHQQRQASFRSRLHHPRLLRRWPWRAFCTSPFAWLPCDSTFSSI